ASNSELVEPLPKPERTLNRRLRRQNRRVPFEQRNNPPQQLIVVYAPILDMNDFLHFLVTLQNLNPMDDEPMWVADRIVAQTPEKQKHGWTNSMKELSKHRTNFEPLSLDDSFPQLFSIDSLEKSKPFSQHENESLTDAWLRIKEMLIDCHGHNLSKYNIIKIFYHSLNEITQEVPNTTSGGIFLCKTPNQSYQLLEDKVVLKLDWAKNQKTKSSLRKPLLSPLKVVTMAVSEHFLHTKSNIDRVPSRCAFKVDIQKAYDTVDWGFLKEVLVGFGFHARMIGWIMECVTTTSFSISINGSLHGFYKRGLRQGDPLYPYLFTLVMEILTLMLQRQVREYMVFKYHRYCGELELINLCFTDDLFLFAHRDVEFAIMIKDALEEFKNVSGLTSSLPKSRAKVAWEVVCLPKDRGGLGIRRLDIFNKALMVTHIWKFLSMKESLWVKWIHAYKLRGDGATSSVWFDKWSEGDPLVNTVSSWDIFCAGLDFSTKVHDVILHGAWNWPSYLCAKYPNLSMLVVPNIMENTPDRLVWQNVQGIDKPFSCMRTRNSYFLNNSSVTIPRRQNKRHTPNVVELELCTIVEVAPMEDNRTMEELLQAPTEGYREAIVIPEINADHFEIKTNLLQLKVPQHISTPDQTSWETLFHTSMPIPGSVVCNSQDPSLNLQVRIVLKCVKITKNEQYLHKIRSHKEKPDQEVSF
nr:RNA-directed DNA polymerase, eukaryota, reverse transcriptase zinc-binding domain protein [Tanacetum cinerariifolium]